MNAMLQVSPCETPPFLACDDGLELRCGSGLPVSPGIIIKNHVMGPSRVYTYEIVFWRSQEQERGRVAPESVVQNGITKLISEGHKPLDARFADFFVTNPELLSIQHHQCVRFWSPDFKTERGSDTLVRSIFMKGSTLVADFDYIKGGIGPHEYIPFHSSVPDLVL